MQTFEIFIWMACDFHPLSKEINNRRKYLAKLNYENLTRKGVTVLNNKLMNRQ